MADGNNEIQGVLAAGSLFKRLTSRCRYSLGFRSSCRLSTEKAYVLKLPRALADKIPKRLFLGSKYVEVVVSPSEPECALEDDGTKSEHRD